jgi:alkylation response protein AidB-like acyl-CoA dehydrogenase
MDFAYTPEDVAFRDELCGWLDENLPKFLADWTSDDDPGGGRLAAIGRTQERRRDWQRRLNDGKWAAINWPKDWGGREATPAQNVIYAEEMARVRAPGIYNANGLWQIGPMIIAWGTEEQQQR